MVTILTRRLYLASSNPVEPTYISNCFDFSTRIKCENLPVPNHLYSKQNRINYQTLKFPCWIEYYRSFSRFLRDPMLKIEVPTSHVPASVGAKCERLTR